MIRFLSIVLLGLGLCLTVLFCNLYTDTPDLVNLPMDSETVQVCSKKEVTKIGLSIRCWKGYIKIDPMITEIVDRAFADASITAIDFADCNQNFTKIGDHAFSNNKIAGSLSIPNSVKSIGHNAFSRNDISSLNIPYAVIHIGDGAFSHNKITGPLKIGLSVESIGKYAFANNEISGSIIVPDKVISIGKNAFLNNDKITSICYEGNRPSTEQRDPSFFGLRVSLKKCSIPTCKNKDTRSNIGKCSVGEIRMDPSLEEVSGKAFYNLKSLTYVDFSNCSLLKHIKASAFRDNKLASLELPSSLESIGEQAFSYNEISGHVIIPSSVKAIGEAAFTGNRITSLTLSKSLTSIPKWGFENNQILKLEIPSSVTTIGDIAFEGNGMESLTLPSSITKIGNRAFYWNRITSVVIPEFVTYIGYWAFMSNQIRGHLSIPEKVNYIGGYAFAMNQIEALTLPPTINTIMKYSFMSNNISTLTLPDSISTIDEGAFMDNKITGFLNIPKFVTSLGMYVFDSNKITSVSIPPSLSNIPRYGFSFNQISFLDIPQTVTRIGEGAFQNNRLSHLIIPATVEDMGLYVFLGNPLEWACYEGKEPPYLIDKYFKRQSVHKDAFLFGIPPEVTLVKCTAEHRKNRKNNLRVNKVASTLISTSASTSTVTSSDASISGGGRGAGCKNKNSPSMSCSSGAIIIDPSLVEVEFRAFFNTKDITHVDFSKSTQLKSIGGYAFVNNKIRNLRIPAWVNNIGEKAFLENPLSSACYEGERQPSPEKPPSYFGIQIPFKRCAAMMMKDVLIPPPF